jgi:hypothetical protein
MSRLRHRDEHAATPEELVLAVEVSRAAHVWQQPALQRDAACDRERRA